MARYAYIEDGVIQGLYDYPPQNWKSISNFNQLTDIELSVHGFVRITESKNKTDYDPLTEYLHPPTYEVLADGSVLETVKKQPRMDLDNVVQQQWEMTRRIRDDLIDQFQWRYDRYHREVRMGRTPTDDIRALDEYVQQLADITFQGDPYLAKWPTPPEGN